MCTYHREKNAAFKTMERTTYTGKRYYYQDTPGMIRTLPRINRNYLQEVKAGEPHKALPDNQLSAQKRGRL